jgi:hypothetical protein
LECSEISKTWNNYHLSYDPLLDDILSNHSKFKLNTQEKKYAECGDYLKLGDKNIWLQFHYEHFERCRLVAYIEGDILKIWSIVSTPKRTGLGSRTLEFLNQKILESGCNLKLFIVDVWPVAKGFWDKMEKRNLITGYEVSEITI